MEAKDLRFASVLVYRRVSDLPQGLRRICVCNGLQEFSKVLMRVIGCGRSEAGADSALRPFMAEEWRRDDGQEMLEVCTLVVSAVPDVENMDKSEIIKEFKKSLRYGRR